MARHPFQLDRVEARQHGVDVLQSGAQDVNRGLLLALQVTHDEIAIAGDEHLAGAFGVSEVECQAQRLQFGFVAAAVAAARLRQLEAAAVGRNDQRAKAETAWIGQGTTVEPQLPALCIGLPGGLIRRSVHGVTALCKAGWCHAQRRTTRLRGDRAGFPYNPPSPNRPDAGILETHMGFLAGKKILITGLLSNRSIAYGIAQACHREGAELAFTYVSDRFVDRVAKMAAEFGSDIVLPCDVSDDAQITGLFDELAKKWDGLDGLVHSIAFAPGEALDGDFLDGLSREAFRIAHEVSAYSFPALAKAARPMMQGRNGAVLTLSYLGAVRALPNYNVMGLAKASLEASVRYLAASLGPQGIRANAVSAGPIKTLAASGIGNFGKLLAYNEKNAPLRRNVTIQEVGNVAAFLLSDLASGVTGEVTYVDAGFSQTALTAVD